VPITPQGREAISPSKLAQQRGKTEPLGLDSREGDEKAMWDAEKYTPCGEQARTGKTVTIVALTNEGRQ